MPPVIINLASGPIATAAAPGSKNGTYHDGFISCTLRMTLGWNMADRILMMVSLLSLLGTLGLYGYSVLAPPAGFPGIGPGAIEGSYIRVEGLVLEVRPLLNGAMCAEILIGGRPPGVRLYIPPDTDGTGAIKGTLLTGAEVRVDGRLQEYNGELEIVLDHAHELRLLKASSLDMAWKRPDILANASVCFAGWAFYKELVKGRLHFRLLDRSNRSCELNCSATSYDPADENARWGNGTLVRVHGRLRYPGDQTVPCLYVLGGAGGIEPLG